MLKGKRLLWRNSLFRECLPTQILQQLIVKTYSVGSPLTEVPEIKYTTYCIRKGEYQWIIFMQKLRLLFQNASPAKWKWRTANSYGYLFHFPNTHTVKSSQQRTVFLSKTTLTAPLDSTIRTDNDSDWCRYYFSDKRSDLVLSIWLHQIRLLGHWWIPFFSSFGNNGCGIFLLSIIKYQKKKIMVASLGKAMELPRGLINILQPNNE
jgi:hypothetical protein